VRTVTAPEPRAASAHHLPAEVATRIRATAAPVAAVDHHRRRDFIARILAVELAGRSRAT